jgi:hypothetical protein
VLLRQGPAPFGIPPTGSLPGPDRSAHKQPDYPIDLPVRFPAGSRKEIITIAPGPLPPLRGPADRPEAMAPVSRGGTRKGPPCRW